jgi:hypothetical protein
MHLAQPLTIVNIRFTSSLTDHDENTIAPALLKAVVSILDALPIAYVVRIDTSDSQVYTHSRPLDSPEDTPEFRRDIRSSRPSLVGR